MTAQLRVSHRTGFTYEGEVTSSYNEARMTPPTTQDQVVLHSRLDVLPTPWMFSYTDYWGTQVTAFEVHERHRELAVTSTSTVEVSAPTRTGAGLDWGELHEATSGGDHAETLTVSDLVRPSDELLAMVRPLAAGAATPSGYARAVVDLVRREVRYIPGSTLVHGTAEVAWDARAGVCQDMAHITLGCLRDAGVPARYVSGYLLPRAGLGVGESMTGQSHAWVEWWDGEWVGFDPTNGIAPGEGHVVVGHGREYPDVAPLTGIFSGGATSSMFVEVEITRLR